MNRRHWLKCAAAAATAGALPHALGAAEPARATPANKLNVVIILADDLGYGDAQCYNPQRGKIPTPQIDRLASQGMRFTDAHSSSGVCSPSRYTILTGRYHWRSRLQTGIVKLWERPLIAPDRLTIAGLAKRQGYQTACIGKWHLGWDWPASPAERKYLTGFGFDGAPTSKIAQVVSEKHIEVWREIFSRPIAGGPISRGFDSYFGTDVPNWPPFCFIENDRTVGIPTRLLDIHQFEHNLASQQGPALEDWPLEKILPTLADRACTFIAEAAKKPEPFLLYLPLTSPHTPLAVTPEWQGKSGLGCAYADLVMETDAVTGRVVDALERNGLADNTLVIFTSDNGCASYIGVPQMEAKGHFPSGPFRGYKFDAWEGGHRIPFVVRWPGKVQPNSVCNQLVHQADIMATLADLWQVKLPDNAGEDSFSLAPLLRGTDAPVRSHAVSCSVNGIAALRSGPWKLICPPDRRAPLALYNLDTDPGEKTDLAAREPERVTAATRVLAKLIADGRSTPGAIQPNDVRVNLPLEGR